MHADNFHLVELRSFKLLAVVNALISARSSDKPTFINIRTIIGFGSVNQGQAKTHGAALGVEDIANIKRSSGLNPEEHFIIPDDVYDFFKDVGDRGETYEAEWASKLNKYDVQYPKEAKEFRLRVQGRSPVDWRNLIPSKDQLPTEPTASRKSAGLVGNPLGEAVPNFMIGTADLTPSCNVAYPNKVDFQSVRWHRCAHIL